MSEPPPYIAVLGADESADERACDRARAVGRELAERGAIVVCGAGGGVMEAACRGALERGGTTVGLLAGVDRESGNSHCSISIPTGLGEARNVLIVRAADAAIAIQGEWGTLSEIAFALKTGKPVVGLGTWELARGGEPVDAFERASSPEEAVERALELARDAARERRDEGGSQGEREAPG